MSDSRNKDSTVYLHLFEGDKFDSELLDGIYSVFKYSGMSMLIDEMNSLVEIYFKMRANNWFYQLSWQSR